MFDALVIISFRTKYGLNDFTALGKPEKKDEICQPVERYIPPYNGFGTYEDSLGNCLSIIPKAPQTDFIKFLYYDKYVFIISMYLSYFLYFSSFQRDSGFFRDKAGLRQSRFKIQSANDIENTRKFGETIHPKILSYR